MNLNNFNNINPKQIAELKLKAYKFLIWGFFFGNVCIVTLTAVLSKNLLLSSLGLVNFVGVFFACRLLQNTVFTMLKYQLEEKKENDQLKGGITNGKKI